MTNKISSNRMTIFTRQILEFWRDAVSALQEMTPPNRWFHVFWLLGPLFMLIERSPADAWITICGLVFLVRAVIKRQIDWLNCFWVRAVFVFWGFCLLSSALSDLPLYSLGEAFIWIRFPLFAMATCFWLGTDKRLLYAMVGITIFGMLVMSCILTAELLIVGQQGNRLSWPYGDLVPGNYLAKAALPAFTVLVALAVSKFHPFNQFAAAVSAFTILISVFTGERINFLLRACGGMLAGLVWRPTLKRYLWLLFIEISAILSVWAISPSIGNRFVHNFLESIPTNSQSPYFKVMQTGLIVFERSPLLGIGTANYRHLCVEKSQGVSNTVCQNHPHNFYVQLLAEVGLLGSLSGCVMILGILWYSIQTNIQGRTNLLAAVSFVIPLGLFFPLRSTADFFGQWNNSFMWSALAIALAARTVVKVDNSIRTTKHRG